MSKVLKAKALTDAILATGSDRVAMSSMPVGEKFKVSVEQPDSVDEITNNTVAQLEARIDGETIKGVVSMFRIGGMLAIQKGLTGMSATPNSKYGMKGKVVTGTGTKTIGTSREGREIGIQPFNQLIKTLDGDITKLKIENMEFKVIGHLAQTNRRSVGTTQEEKLLHTHDSYMGYEEFEIETANLDFNVEGDPQLFTNATRKLFATELRSNVEAGDEARLQLTPVVQIQ